MADLITSDELVPEPHELVRDAAPETIAEWKALADGLLTDQSCAFHRNLEISSRYAWVYKLLPDCFKWAGMAAFASHHVRLALFPFRLDTDRTGYVDIPHSLASPEGAADHGREHDPRDQQRHLRRHLLGAPRVRHRRGRDRAAPPAPGSGAPLRPGARRLRGDRPGTPCPGGRAASAEARRAAADLIWMGNVQLLEHEQRALVQPNLDRLSCAFARLFSIGSALTFEVRGLREEVSYFTSFYLYSLTRGIPQALQAHTWPRITRYDDRWRWIVTSIVPRFRRFDADTRVLDASLRRIFDEARDYASNPCVLPR